MNQLVKINDGVTVVADPFQPDVYHNATNVGALVSSANARVVMRRKEFDDLGELAKAPTEAVKELYKAIKADDDTLRDFDGDIKNALLKMSGFDAFIVQTKGAGSRIDELSVRGKFAKMLKALKETIDSRKVVEPPRAWVVRMDMNGDQFKAVAKAAEKAGCPFQQFAVAQSDKAVKAIGKWFDENM